MNYHQNSWPQLVSETRDAEPTTWNIGVHASKASNFLLQKIYNPAALADFASHFSQEYLAKKEGREKKNKSPTLFTHFQPLISSIFGFKIAETKQPPPPLVTWLKLVNLNKETYHNYL